MKKYLAAAAVAVMVFAFSAMAASLTVDGGTLQAGIDNDLTCFDTAEVSYLTGYNQAAGSATYSSDEPFDVRAINVELTGYDGCDLTDLRGHLKVNDGDANPIGPHGYGIASITEDNGVYSFELNVPASSLLVQEVNQVQVMVKAFTNPLEDTGYYSGVFDFGGNTNS